MAANDSSSFLKNLTDSYVKQIDMLRIMSSEGGRAPAPRQYQIDEIAKLTGTRDEKEVQRYLFILEGQKLVTPCPAGDFTSRTWQITRRGLRAVKTIKGALVQ